LNYINIHKATVFPELEYQMSYVRMSNERFVKSDIGSFSPIVNDNEFDMEIIETPANDGIIEDWLNQNLKIIVARRIINIQVTNEIVSVFIANAKLDWYYKETLQSQIRMAIFRKLLSYSEYNVDSARILSESIFEETKKDLTSYLNEKPFPPCPTPNPILKTP
jgi:hypothetical protein